MGNDVNIAAIRGDALAALVDDIEALYPGLPGVSGPAYAAEAFSRLSADRAGVAWRLCPAGCWRPESPFAAYMPTWTIRLRIRFMRSLVSSRCATMSSLYSSRLDTARRFFARTQLE
jgi:hypothetical protein